MGVLDNYLNIWKIVNFISKEPIRQSKIFLQCIKRLCSDKDFCFPNLKLNVFYSIIFVPVFYERELIVWCSIENFSITSPFSNIFQQNYRGLGRAHSKRFCTDVGKSLKRGKCLWLILHLYLDCGRNTGVFHRWEIRYNV